MSQDQTPVQETAGLNGETIESFNVVSQGRKFVALADNVLVHPDTVFTTHIRENDYDYDGKEATVCYTIVPPRNGDSRHVVLAVALTEYNPNDAKNGSFFKKALGRKIATERLEMMVRNATYVGANEGIEDRTIADEWWGDLLVLDIPWSECFQPEAGKTGRAPNYGFVRDCLRAFVRNVAMKEIMNPYSERNETRMSSIIEEIHKKEELDGEDEDSFVHHEAHQFPENREYRFEPIGAGGSVVTLVGTKDDLYEALKGPDANLGPAIGSPMDEFHGNVNAPLMRGETAEICGITIVEDPSMEKGGFRVGELHRTTVVVSQIIGADGERGETKVVEDIEAFESGVSLVDRSSSKESSTSATPLVVAAKTGPKEPTFIASRDELLKTFGGDAPPADKL